MILTYEFFVEKLNEKIKSDADFCYELLKNVIDISLSPYLKSLSKRKSTIRNRFRHSICFISIRRF